MREAAGISLAGIFEARLGLAAEQHGAGGGIMDIDEVELGFDGVVADALELLIDADHRLDALVAGHADRGAALMLGLEAGREGHAGEVDRLVVMAGDAGDDGAGRRRMIDLAGRGAVGAEQIAEAGRGMAARAFDRDNAFLVPMIERLGFFVGVR